MDIYFMLAYTRDTTAPNEVLVSLFEQLGRRGHTVTLGVARELILDAANLGARREEHDLYILKSHSSLWLSLAGVLHTQGAQMLNPYLACLAAHDKIVAERRMEAAGIPTPHSWVTGDLGLLRAVAELQPLIVKPYHGGRGAGVVLVRGARELAALEHPAEPVLVQEYIPGDEIKVYAIGERIFGVRKVDGPNGPVRVPCGVSDEVQAIARRCGQVFGLSLYGLDVIEGPSGPMVIDLNYFPSYKGVPQAPALLADAIEEYAADRRARGRLAFVPAARAS